ncbi:MAG TPA: hypothetical protein VMW24_03320, partial [Sedimentisphaerales bacterium]|nr:hypothetical protein [Sedimentisphaerales bacterium]
MKTFTRRSLLKHTAGWMASTVAVPYLAPSSVLGAGPTPAPSERLTMGAIGLGGQGMHNLRNFLTCEDLRLLAVCDVDAKHRATAKETVDA